MEHSSFLPACLCLIQPLLFCTTIRILLQNLDQAVTQSEIEKVPRDIQGGKSGNHKMSDIFVNSMRIIRNTSGVTQYFPIKSFVLSNISTTKAELALDKLFRELIIFVYRDFHKHTKSLTLNNCIKLLRSLSIDTTILKIRTGPAGGLYVCLYSSLLWLCLIIQEKNVLPQ